MCTASLEDRRCFAMVRSEGFRGLRVETEHLKEKKRSTGRQAKRRFFLLNGSSTQYTEHIANKAQLNPYCEC